MPGMTFRTPGGIVHIDTFIDDEGTAVVNGRQYQWEFHEYLGPTFIRKDGEPLKRQPGEHHPVWPHFEKWLKAREK